MLYSFFVNEIYYSYFIQEKKFIQRKKMNNLFVLNIDNLKNTKQIKST